MTDNTTPPQSKPEEDREPKPNDSSHDEIKTTEPAAKTHTHRVAGRSGGSGT